jgi:hypothetical protein
VRSRLRLPSFLLLLTAPSLDLRLILLRCTTCKMLQFGGKRLLLFVCPVAGTQLPSNWLTEVFTDRRFTAENTEGVQQKREAARGDIQGEGGPRES